jgi:hypothetical protein
MGDRPTDVEEAMGSIAVRHLSESSMRKCEKECEIRVFFD